MGALLLISLAALPADAPVSAPVAPPAYQLTAEATPGISVAARSSTLSAATAFERAQFPRIPVLSFLKGIGLTLARPINPQLSDVFIIAPAMLGTVVAYDTDIATHRAFNSLPDPMIGDRQLSFFVSELGEGWVDLAVFLGLGLFGGRDGQRACLAGVQALIASALASRVGKVVFRVERPSFDPGEHHLWSRVQADAMPSGHAMAAFATAAVLASEYRTLAPLWYALAAWVGIARVQQSTHWLSDVVVGAALGTLFGLEAYRVTKAMEVDLQPWAGADGGGVSVSRRF